MLRWPHWASHDRRKPVPRPPDKWEEVEIPRGTLQIRATERLWETGAQRRAKWVDLEKGDLERLRLEVSTRPVARLVGPTISGAYPLVSATTNYNAMKAFCCRVLRRPPPPRGGLWRWAAQFRSLLLPGFPGNMPAEMSVPDWLASMPPERRVPLTQAYELYLRTGWTKKYEDFHSFVKTEFLPRNSKEPWGLAPLRDVVDRLINAPHDVTHVIAGPKIKPYTAWLKQQWHHENYIFYGSAIPSCVPLLRPARRFGTRRRPRKEPCRTHSKWRWQAQYHRGRLR